jgi:AcrR family transcriptional regulator
MSTARRGGYAKGRERREAILHAADEVFAAQGFHKAALSTIAKQVGLSEPGLLHHFPSKEHLLLELLAMRHEHDAERVARAMRHHETFLDALLGLCRENEDTPGLVRLFTILAAESVDDDHPAHDWTVERYRTLRERFATRIAREQRDGHIDAHIDPHRLAPQLIAMFDGLQVQWLLEPDAVDMAAVFADFLDRLRPAADPHRG